MGSYHEWGDQTFDWKALYEAERIVDTIGRKYGRISMHTKEKYGTLRAYCNLFDGTIHSLLYPGFVYCQYKFLRDYRWYLEIYFWPKFFKYTGLGWVITQYQKMMYSLAYYVAMKKYPHIAEEICVAADYPELIIGGKEIHNKYWEPGI